MWWEDDSWVSDRVRVLSQARRDGLLPGVTVIGSTWTEDGDRTVFVGVRPHRDLRPWALAPGRGARARLVRALARRYGPLPGRSREPSRPGWDDRSDDRDTGILVRDPTAAASLRQVVASLFLLRRLEVEERARLLTLPLSEADPLTEEELARFDLPAVCRIGYLGPIRSRAGRGNAVFRKWSGKQATIGSALDAERGSFVTTAGHLGARLGESVYERRSWFALRRTPLGRVAAVTSPETPDAAVANEGLDVAAITAECPSGAWEEVEPGDPRRLRRSDYVSWVGGKTGAHTGAVMILAKDAEAMEGVDYQHAVMVLGNHPNLAGAGGDSGTGMYDGAGRLLGYFVGTEGGRSPRGIAPAAWFQMIDAVHPYLEHHCGPIQAYRGDGGLS